MSPIERTSRWGRNILATVAVSTVLVGAPVLGTVIATGGGGGGPGPEVVANIWVDTDGGSCADNTEEVRYDTAIACSTISSAFAAAEPGDEIMVREGEYAFTTIARRSALEDLSPGCDPYGEWGAASETNCIRIRNDGEVYVRGMVNNASSLWLQGLVSGETVGSGGSPQDMAARQYDFHITNSDLIGNPPAGAAATGCNCQSANFRAARPATTSNDTTRPDHITIDGIDSDTVSVYASSNVLIRNLDVGPMWFDTPNPGSASGAGPDVPRVWGTCATSCPPIDIVFDGVLFHEMNRTYDCDLNNACHNDGLYVKNGGPVTIRNSGFSQVAGEVLFFENFTNDAYYTRDVTVENTWFGCKVDSYPDAPSTARTTCGSGAPIDIKNCGTTCEDFLFRYNSWYSIVATETSFTNARFVGNAGRQPGSTDPLCAGATWTYNVFYTGTGGSNCGATNTNTGSSSATSLFTNVTAGSENFHLAGAAGSTTADNFVTPTTSDYTVTTDMDGEGRTPGSRDAGADER